MVQLFSGDYIDLGITQRILWILVWRNG